MHELAERLLTTIRKNELLHAGDRVAVAVSGGADSVALLRLLVELGPELGIVLSVAHVNHKLRGVESDEDERFVARLAAGFELELATRTAPVKREQGGIESAARRLRYEFFLELARDGRVAKIVTAHTLDDQAETVLLRMFRGTGIRGLGGILPRLRLHDAALRCPDEAPFYGEVVRLLLGFRRAELREYLRERGQDWREDSSNEDESFLRNRVRRRLMPLIEEEFGAAAVEHMAEHAEIARAEEELVSSQYSVPSTQLPVADYQLPVLTTPSLGPRTSGAALPVQQLLALPLAAARRVARAWIETNAPEASISFRLIEEILDLARCPAGKKIELPGGGGSDAGLMTDQTEISCSKKTCSRIVRRGRSELVLETLTDDVTTYQYELPVPGEVLITELGARFRAEMVDMESVPELERQALLDPARLGAKVVIRNWRAGDRYWPANTSKEKKVKELLSDRHATGTEKKLWPVGEWQGELVWMRGFAVPKAWQVRSGRAIWIREIGPKFKTS
ncbi:MAG: tRNA lysidine(34) synthetase TilS [Terriglobales bacterium]|jgi:tRNA(Ile)-lysidine synthase